MAAEQLGPDAVHASMINELGEHVWLQWRNDWGVDYLAHESWTGTASMGDQAVRFGDSVNFLTGRGSFEVGVVVMQSRQASVSDHGHTRRTKFEVPMIEWEVDGTTVLIDPASVRIQRASLPCVPMPAE